jgi:hypothetical protein
MPVTFQGPTFLAQLLTAQAHVRIVNLAEAGDAIAIVAVALVRHDGAGGAQRDTAFALNLLPGESVVLEPAPPTPAAPQAVEALMRLRVAQPGDTQARFVDVYASSDRGTADAQQGFEVGVRHHDAVITAGEVLVDGYSQFAAFVRAAV